MRALRLLLISAPFLLLSGGLFALSGCDSRPAEGTQASPVNKEEAASQGKAVQDYYKSKTPKGKTPKARPTP